MLIAKLRFPKNGDFFELSGGFQKGPAKSFKRTLDYIVLYTVSKAEMARGSETGAGNGKNIFFQEKAYKLYVVGYGAFGK